MYNDKHSSSYNSTDEIFCENIESKSIYNLASLVSLLFRKSYLIYWYLFAIWFLINLSLAFFSVYSFSVFVFLSSILPLLALLIIKLLKKSYKANKNRLEEKKKSDKHYLNRVIEDALHIETGNKKVFPKFLRQRFAAFVIDKLFILLLTLSIIFISTLCDVRVASNLGIFCSLFSMSADDFNSCAEGWVIDEHIGRGDYNKLSFEISDHQEEVNTWYSFLQELDITIMFLFTIIVVGYYAFSELLWRASLGKHLLEMKTIDINTKAVISFRHIWNRALCLFCMMTAMVGLRWTVLSSLNYWELAFIIIPVFYFPVIYPGKGTLLDWITKTNLEIDAKKKLNDLSLYYKRHDTNVLE